MSFDFSGVAKVFYILYDADNTCWLCGTKDVAEILMQDSSIECYVTRNKIDLNKVVRVTPSCDISQLADCVLLELNATTLRPLHRAHFDCIRLEYVKKGYLDFLNYKPSGISRFVHLLIANNGVCEYYVSEELYEVLVKIEPNLSGITITTVDNPRLKNMPIITADSTFQQEHLDRTHTYCVTCRDKYAIKAFLESQGYLVSTVFKVADKAEYCNDVNNLCYMYGFIRVNTERIPMVAEEVVNLMNSMKSLKGTTASEFFRTTVADIVDSSKISEYGFVPVCKDIKGTHLYGAWSPDCINCFCLIYGKALLNFYVDINKFT